jgi:hypothetical protein
MLDNRMRYLHNIALADEKIPTNGEGGYMKNCDAVRLLFIIAVFLGTCLSTIGFAEDPVQFSDPLLQQAIEEALWVSDPTPTDMLALTTLRVVRTEGSSGGIQDLDGLEYAINMDSLWLREHEFSNISALASMPHLRTLHLSRNDIKDLSPLSDLTDLKHLDLHANNISDVGPLSHLPSLDTLILRYNKINDLSPLGSLTSLSHLSLHSNSVADISPLSNLTNLKELILPRNRIDDLSPLETLSKLQRLVLLFNRVKDITPLASLPQLRELLLYYNNISSIAPLRGFTQLRELDLRNNPLDSDAYCSDLHEIASNNSFASIDYTTNPQAPVAVRATDGLYAKRVDIQWDPVCNGPHYNTYYQISRAPTDNPDARTEISPWQTDLAYTDANTPAGSSYQYWVRSSSSVQGHSPSPYSEPDTGWTSGVQILFVNDDALHDPAPGDLLISDPNEEGTLPHPFDSIQEAIQAALPGATVHVAKGYYPETLDLLGKSIHLIGSDPNHPEKLLYPVIDGIGSGPVLRFVSGEDPNCIIEGFTITGGQALHAAAIDCWASDPTLKNCLIVGHQASDPNGAIIYCQDSQARFVNCTIADNQAGETGACLLLVNSQVRVRNSILWENFPSSFIILENIDPIISYTLLPGGWPNNGNLSQAPLFVRSESEAVHTSEDDLSGSADYHLQSQFGRWDSITRNWVYDAVTSPAVDAGDPNSPVGLETSPHGNRINLGAYGGTEQASASFTSVLTY